MTYVPLNYVAQGAWEQFFFEDEPFAIHVGKVSYANNDTEAKIEHVLAAVRTESGFVQ